MIWVDDRLRRRSYEDAGYRRVVDSGPGEEGGGYGRGYSVIDNQHKRECKGCAVG